MQRYSIAIIGAGPGGYVAAIKAAQLGHSVVLIEKESVGGTCLNVGCIPTKTLISYASIFKTVKNAKNFSIETGNVSFDFSKIQTSKDRIIEHLRKGVEGLIKANNITLIKGDAKFTSPNELKVFGQELIELHAEHIIIATGSSPIDIPAFPCDGKKIHNSTSILALKELPSSLAIIGGGYIGCEFASLYATFGVKVFLIESLPSILQLMGKTLSSEATQLLKKQGVEILSSKMVTSIEKKEKTLEIHFKDGSSIDADMSLISVGRKPCTNTLDLVKAGVQTDAKGNIPVDEYLRTNVPHIYAIGDITAKAMLAHVASHQGIIAVLNCVGQKKKISYEAIPSVIFTLPEIAQVGYTEEQAKEKGMDILIGKFPFAALGKAQASLQTEGFAQIIADTKTHKILGACVIGKEASSLIAEITLAIENELTLDCITETIHAHPTLPEIWMEAAFLAKGTPFHLPPKKTGV